jgi:hypothetical protein
MYEYDVDLIIESTSSDTYQRFFPHVKAIHKYQSDYVNPEMPVSISVPKMLKQSIGNQNQKDENGTVKGKIYDFKAVIVFKCSRH